jgi:hypothetical protein
MRAGVVFESQAEDAAEVAKALIDIVAVVIEG